jgi:hypothetical protein
MAIILGKQLDGGCNYAVSEHAPFQLIGEGQDADSSHDRKHAPAGTIALLATKTLEGNHESSNCAERGLHLYVPGGRHAVVPLVASIQQGASDPPYG